MTTESIIIREAREALHAAEERLEFTRHLLTELEELRVAQHVMERDHDLLAALALPPMAAAPRHDDAVTPNVPEGYDTILGYLAKHHADILDTFDYTVPDATVRDGFKLAYWARTAGYAARYVDAPPCLRAHDILSVRAYPVTLLQQRWG